MAPHVAGRSSEMRAITRFLALPPAGRPQVMVISGAAGIGKTTVWRYAVAEARGLSYRVLTARPVAAEAQVAFGVLTDLLSPLDERLFEGLPTPQRRALSVALMREDPDDRHDPRAVSAAVLSLIMMLSRAQPVVVAVDDLQWMDTASARVLEYVARRLDERRIAIIVSERVDTSVTRSTELERAVDEQDVSRVDVGPLSFDAVSQILERRVARALPRRTVARIHDVAAGNPFYALELASSLPGDITTGLAALPVPRTLRDLVDARLGALPPSTRQTLLAAATLRSPTLRTVAAGVASTQAAAREALDPAVEAGVIEPDEDGRGLRFTHPLYAAGVYALAGESDRRHVHRNVAAAVSDLEERAHHLALAGLGTDPALAELLDLAADHARARGAPELATELAVQARLATPPDRRTDLAHRTIAVAEYRFHVGELQPARQMLEQLLRLEPTIAPSRDALRLHGEIRYHQDSFHDAVELFTLALEGGDPDPALTCQIELHLTFAMISAGDIAGTQVHAHRAPSVTRSRTKGWWPRRWLSRRSRTTCSVGGSTSAAWIWP